MQYTEGSLRGWMEVRVPVCGNIHQNEVAESRLTHVEDGLHGWVQQMKVLTDPLAIRHVRIMPGAGVVEAPENRSAPYESALPFST